MISETRATCLFQSLCFITLFIVMHVLTCLKTTVRVQNNFFQICSNLQAVFKTKISTGSFAQIE